MLIHFTCLKPWRHTFRTPSPAMTLTNRLVTALQLHSYSTQINTIVTVQFFYFVRHLVQRIAKSVQGVSKYASASFFRWYGGEILIEIGRINKTVLNLGANCVSWTITMYSHNSVPVPPPTDREPAVKRVYSVLYCYIIKIDFSQNWVLLNVICHFQKTTELKCVSILRGQNSSSF
jgi:hypothetical protein